MALRKVELLCPFSAEVNRGRREVGGEEGGGPGISEGQVGSIKHVWGTEAWPSLTGAMPAQNCDLRKSTGGACGHGMLVLVAHTCLMVLKRHT